MPSGTRRPPAALPALLAFPPHLPCFQSVDGLVLWRVPKPVAGSTHTCKYRLAYVVGGVCVVRYDNEAGNGDHRHFGEKEAAYVFDTPDSLLADFQRDLARWNREHGHS